MLEGPAGFFGLLLGQGDYFGDGIGSYPAGYGRVLPAFFLLGNPAGETREFPVVFSGKHVWCFPGISLDIKHPDKVYQSICAFANDFANIGNALKASNQADDQADDQDEHHDDHHDDHQE